MKKFYAFAAAAMMAVAANAQSLYVVGSGTGLGWDPENPMVVELTDGNYTFDIKGLNEMKISTAMGGWPDFNAGCYGCNYGTEPGVEVALQTPWEANIKAPEEGVDYTIVVKGDLSTIKMTKTGGTVDPNAGNLYLRGDMNNWCNDFFEEGKLVDPEGMSVWQLKPAGENIYKLVFAEGQAIGLGETFKIANPSWSNNFGGATDIMTETPTQVNPSGDNMTTEEEITGCIWLTTDFEGAAYVEVSNDKEYVPEWAEGGDSAVSSIAADNNVVAKYFNLQGVQVANPENGLFIVVKGDKATKVLVK